MRFEQWNAWVLLACGTVLGICIGVALYVASAADGAAGAGIGTTESSFVFKEWQTLIAAAVAATIAITTIRITLRQNAINRAVAEHKLISDATVPLEDEIATLNKIPEVHGRVVNLVSDPPLPEWTAEDHNEWFNQTRSYEALLREQIEHLKRHEYRNPRGSPTFATRIECISDLHASVNTMITMRVNVGSLMDDQIDGADFDYRLEVAVEIVSRPIISMPTHAKVLTSAIDRSRARMRELEQLVSQ